MKKEISQTALSILLVEDDEDTRELTGDLLRGSGAYKVTLVSTAESGLEQLRVGGYGLLITDIGLPGLSGLEMLDQAAREGLLSCETTVIVCSAAQTCTRDGVRFMRKPFDNRELCRLVGERMASQATKRDVS